MTASELSDLTSVHPPARQRDLGKSLRCRRRFLKVFPGGFHDETYLDWERDYKWEAHKRWEASLGREHFRELLREQHFAEIAVRAVTVEQRSGGPLPVSVRHRRTWLPFRQVGQGRRGSAATADPRADMADGDRVGLPRTAAHPHILQAGRDQTRCRTLRQTARLCITTELVDVLGTTAARSGREARPPGHATPRHDRHSVVSVGARLRRVQVKRGGRRSTLSAAAEPGIGVLLTLPIKNVRAIRDEIRTCVQELVEEQSSASR